MGEVVWIEGVREIGWVGNRVLEWWDFESFVAPAHSSDALERNWLLRPFTPAEWAFSTI